MISKEIEKLKELSKLKFYTNLRDDIRKYKFNKEQMRYLEGTEKQRKYASDLKREQLNSVINLLIGSSAFKDELISADFVTFFCNNRLLIEDVLEIESICQIHINEACSGIDIGEGNKIFEDKTLIKMLENKIDKTTKLIINEKNSKVVIEALKGNGDTIFDALINIEAYNEIYEKKDNGEKVSVSNEQEIIKEKMKDEFQEVIELIKQLEKKYCSNN